MTDPDRYPLLSTIDTPVELRALPESDLVRLAAELREFLVESVSKTGGHLAAGLGMVELTIALHYVYNTPEDRLVWDVGHQSYPHKILTGRRDRMHTLRQKGGLAGFPRRDESPYDTFGVGHSSTSISAALGMAEAAKRNGDDRQVVAIIGDGAMTAGMAFEALNHAGDLDTDFLVILNDNDMSISRNVGAMSNYFGRILSSRTYTSMREGSKKVLHQLPMPFQELARRAEEHMKGMVVPGTLFEELGFNYVGPVDGHDLPTLISTLKTLKTVKGPRLLHLVTRKGKGFEPAERNPSTYHGVGSFNPQNGEIIKGGDTGPTYTQVFGRWLCDMAERDPSLLAITPAMEEGSGMVEFAERYTERYFDVGIAEQHAVTLAAGLACEGFHPVVAIYSTFLQRAYDQLIHDVALQNLPVLFAIDRGGLVGADGPTHAGAYDLSYLRCIPNMVVMAPADENECRQMLYTGMRIDGPAAVRYPRGTGPGVTPQEHMKALAIGRGEIRRQGHGVAILAFGSMLAPALGAAERLGASVANMRFVKPLDTALVEQLATRHDLLVTVEENAIAGGAGSAVNEALAEMGITVPVLNLGLPDRFIEHGNPAELLASCGLDPNGIEQQIRARMAGPIAKIGAGG
jgi:1-deoxy-D-xylulose-5-phosphate synthase